MIQRDDKFDGLVTTAYKQLHTLAHHLRNGKAGNTVGTTSLVHETYLRLSRSETLDVNDESHLLCVAATAMRRFLVDRARRRMAAKHGGGERPIPIREDLDHAKMPDKNLLDLEEALDRLAELDSRKVEIVELKFFAGCKLKEIAAVLDMSISSVAREWELAKVWLFRELKHDVLDKGEAS